MAIEEADLREREVWAGVARMWYDRAPDKSPNVGCIPHHLAVLARPKIEQQPFYYSKALISANPFPNARESVMLLFDPFLANGEIASQRYPYSRGSVSLLFDALIERGDSIDRRDQLMKRPGAVKCRVQEPSQVKNDTEGQTSEDFTLPRFDLAFLPSSWIFPPSVLRLCTPNFWIVKHHLGNTRSSKSFSPIPRLGTTIPVLVLTGH